LGEEPEVKKRGQVFMEEETKEELREKKKEVQASVDAIAEKTEETAAEAPAFEEGVPAEEEEAAKEKKDAAAPEKPLDKMTVKELREVALKMGGIEGVTGMKKEQLLDLIKKAKGIEAEPAKKKPTGVEDTVAELKQKIAALKKEKLEAQKAKDRTQIRVLRRRINRLKKKTRRAALAA
jgi:hypothetical protein